MKVVAPRPTCAVSTAQPADAFFNSKTLLLSAEKAFSKSSVQWRTVQSTSSTYSPNLTQTTPLADNHLSATIKSELISLLLQCDAADCLERLPSTEEDDAQTVIFLRRLVTTNFVDCRGAMSSPFQTLVTRCHRLVVGASRHRNHPRQTRSNETQHDHLKDSRMRPSVWKWLDHAVSVLAPPLLSSTADRDLHFVASFVLASLIVYCEFQRFDSLMMAVCSSNIDDDVEDHSLNLIILDAVLDVASSHVVNRTMTFGDTPLTMAARSRRSDVIAVLLRHGADVTLPSQLGMCCGAIEALLFSPNLVLGRSERELGREGERCLRMMLASVTRIPINRLEALQMNGYYPLCDQWRRAVMEQTCRAWQTSCQPDSDGDGCWQVVAPLQQLVRCAIRTAVCSAAARGGAPGTSFVHRIELLPVPRRLKRQILLEDLD